MESGRQNDKRQLLSIRLENVLSFGPDTQPLELENLNILVGPNASGKSNLIEALALMRAAPVSPAVSDRDLRGVISRGGGVSEWVWKGRKAKSASIDLLLRVPVGLLPLRHVLAFEASHQGFRLTDERIEQPFPRKEDQPFSYQRFSPEYSDRSILSRLRDSRSYPEITFLSETYENIRIYREWAFGRNTVFREPQKADLRNDRLEEDFSNLGLFLSRLRRTPKAKTAILNGLQDLYEGVVDFEPVVEGGTVQVFFTEGDFSVPATRLSDGTLRYLCLLAILCDPDPPPLICIEEPELGLHPDILPRLADLLIQASERTQLIVTTHSDILVDAMTEHPEMVVVCEKHEGKTQMHRLKKEELKDWLTKYRLGELWIRGKVGGTRW